MLNEPLLRMLFIPLGAEGATDMRAAIDAMRDWAEGRQRELVEIGETYLTGDELFPARTQRNIVGGLLLWRLNTTIIEWAQETQRLLDADPSLESFDGRAALAEIRGTATP
jgi:hypothetical protein